MARVGETWGAIDPHASLAWADSIEDPATRVKALTSTLNQWVGLDLEGATAALEQIQLSDVEREKVRKNFPNLVLEEAPEP